MKNISKQFKKVVSFLVYISSTILHSELYVYVYDKLQQLSYKVLCGDQRNQKKKFQRGLGSLCMSAMMGRRTCKCRSLQFHHLELKLFKFDFQIFEQSSHSMFHLSDGVGKFLLQLNNVPIYNFHLMPSLNIHLVQKPIYSFNLLPGHSYVGPDTLERR